VKRGFDIIVALVCLAFAVPVMAVVAMAIWITSGRPVLYVGERVGRHGVPFGMVKFRSMVVHADSVGPLITAGSDPRITAIGRVLRRTKLDELPTLWNVLRGDMSLVGPRPENPRSVALYTDDQRRVLNVRPGVTSSATIKFRHEETLLSGVPNVEAAYLGLMQQKLAIELDYLSRRSFVSDCAILARTVRALVQ
jgi:lipopolysaccharide/colanic/teichoic acid biosynthesis glycosyltransferase